MSDEKIEKAETLSSKSVTRPLTNLNREKGQPRIVTSSRFVQEVRKSELRDLPRRLCTYQAMMENEEAVFNSVDVTNLAVLLSLSEGQVVSKSGSRVSVEAAEFINYCLRNMSYGTWMEFCNNACTDIVNGFSLQNIVLERITHGKYKGLRKLRKLSPRNQMSLYGWVWDKNFRELRGIVQKNNLVQNKEVDVSKFGGDLGINSIVNSVHQSSNYPYISREQLLHFRYNPTDNNPQGDSPLLHCFDAYVEKSIIEQHECIGVTKDMAGALVIRVPSELIERASDPTNYPNEYAEYLSLQTDAAALQKGESSFILLASDVDPQSKVADYDIQFKGIDGGGKQYSTSAIIEQKNKAIYNVFGTGFLLLGQNGTGSYALSTNQKDVHSFYVKRNIMWKKDVIDNQLIPRLLMANNIQLDWKDMPVFKPAEVDELDLDAAGKFIQRAASVMKMTPEGLKYIYEKSGLPTDGIDELDFTDKGESRSGEGLGTSGTGDSQKGGSNSSINMDNKSMRKLVVDGDRIVDTETDKVVNLSDLNQNGEYE